MLTPYRIKSGISNGSVALIDESQVIGVTYGPYERITCTQCFVWKPAREVWSSARIIELPAGWVAAPLINENKAIEFTEISWLEVLVITGMSREQSEQAVKSPWDTFVHNNQRN